MRFSIDRWAIVLLSAFLAARSGFSEPVPDAFQAAQDSLGVGVDVARVVDMQWTPTQAAPEYILVQDVHRHPQVQSQIAALIEHGYDAWGVKKVFLEGAFTTLDLSMFHRVPKKTRFFLMERLVKDGDLSGPEVAAVMIMEREWRNPPVSPFQLFGMENAKLYRQNVQAYEAVLARRERALSDLVTVRRLQMSMHLPEPNVLDEQLGRIDDLLHLKLTSSGYEAYRAAKAANPSMPALNPAIQAAEEFYRLAQLRSHVFLKESLKKAPASSAPRILVVGGFHTAEMAAILRREGHSFVVLSPTVSTGEDALVYEKGMRATARLLSEALVPTSH